MYLLKKVFQLREKVDEEAEKPFLEHLEDLRVTLTRITMALLISTIVCFVFRNELMDIIRRPVQTVWDAKQKEALKDLEVTVESETWELAKLAARDLPQLTPEQRADWYEAAAPGIEDFAFHAESVIYLRAAKDIPDESAGQEIRRKYIEAHRGIDDRMRKQLTKLLDGGAQTTVDAKGKLVLMQALNPTEGFMLSIKLAFFAGIVIAFPFLLYFLLQFVLPGLHKTERRALFPAMVIGFGLFLIGVFFAYYFVLPRVLEFFYSWSLDMGIENEWRIGYYISFATQFTLIFGLAFELPVVVMTLVKLGIMGYDMMKKTRSYAILAIFVIAAIITPTPDAFTLCLLALPMVILYEICIWLAYFIQKKEREQEEVEEKERMERLLAAGPTATAAPGTEPTGEDGDGEAQESESESEGFQEDGGEQSDDYYHYEDDYGSEDEYGSDYDHGEESGAEESEQGDTSETEPAESTDGADDSEEKPGEVAWRETLGSEVPEDSTTEADTPAEETEEIQPEFELDVPDVPDVPDATEEGEEEDVSDPWDEEEEADREEKEDDANGDGKA